MTVDNPLHGRQPDTRAGKLVGCVETLERPEKTRRVRLVKSRAIVAHEICSIAVRNLLAKFNFSLRAFRSKFPGISDQVLESHTNQPAVAFGLQSFGDFQRYRAFWFSGLKFLGNFARELAQIDSLLVHFRARYSR